MRNLTVLNVRGRKIKKRKKNGKSLTVNYIERYEA